MAQLPIPAYTHTTGAGNGEAFGLQGGMAPLAMLGGSDLKFINGTLTY